MATNAELRAASNSVLYGHCDVIGKECSDFIWVSSFSNYLSTFSAPFFKSLSKKARKKKKTSSKNKEQSRKVDMWKGLMPFSIGTQKKQKKH